MLKLQNITKDYVTGDSTVHALRGINLEFRKSEFVSILGQSGCGKTTLLNIIGGLDRYTDGDLIINGKSTKTFNDKNWDTYRNHSIGFVFQSYNLIPHQTVLANVELALTLSGVSKAERKKRAIDALSKVGLGDQLNKRPNQMSGGQMQRVAIARALVNNPDILLADEPTGALDTQTSIQIMEILKEISKDKLIIMVTHNPDLAEQYSTRIIRVLDGLVVDDSNPYTVSEIEQPVESKEEKKQKKKSKEKTSMSFFTAMGLSATNLRTKKGRTVMTALAGSIGIIGIALILSLSNGINSFISDVQRDSLSSYPISIYREETDISSLLASMSNHETEKVEHDNDAVYVNRVFYNLITSMTSSSKKNNNLEKFKAEFIENNSKYPIADNISAIQYSYAAPLNVYIEDRNAKGNYNRTDMTSLITTIYGENSASSSMMNMSSAFSSFSIWSEIIPGKPDSNGNYSSYINDIVYEQYDLIYGEWPQAYNEVVLVVNEDYEINDMTYYALGYISQEEMEQILFDAMRGNEPDENNVPKEEKLSFEEVCNITFKVVPNYAFYIKGNDGYWNDIRKDKTQLNVAVSDEGIDVKIVGVICANKDAMVSSISGSLAYTAALTETIIQKTNESEIVKEQLSEENRNINIITGQNFIKESNVEPTDKEKADAVLDYISKSTETIKANLYIDIMAYLSDEEIQNRLNELKKQFNGGNDLPDITEMSDEEYEKYVDTLVKLMVTQGDYGNLSEESIKNYFNSMSRADLQKLIDETLIEAMIKTPHRESIISEIRALASKPDDKIINSFVQSLKAEYANNSQIQAVVNMLKATLPEGSYTDEQLRKVVIVATSMANETLSADTIIQALLAQYDESKIEKAFEESLTQKAIEIYNENFTVSETEITANISAMLDSYISSLDETQLAETYKHLPSGLSENTYDDNLKLLGVCDIDNPSAVHIYTNSFESKETIGNMISDYNNTVEESDKITYTDMIAILMSSVTIIINAISYVLIAFVSISLVVSSIMIGIITNISVLERIKEIGILRAIGASKRDVSRVFLAETMIIGFFSGLIGIISTVVLCVPITLIVRQVTGISTITASLPWIAGLILQLISMALTTISGIIPAHSASKKDPVIALRSE